MKRKLTLCLALLFTHLLFSQAILKSTVAGFEAKIPLEKSAITIIQKQDSMLVNYGRTRGDGSFDLKIPKAGKYLLFATYPGFLGQSIDFEVKENQKELILDTVFLLGAELLLGEVTVVDSRAIVIKGDTISFSADKFATDKNATVEDLLKKLPGIEVDANGAIKAFGERVEKVYVDGEEFFGDDPTIATKNIQAKAVDKVEVYDKKSAEAELTGIDDGQTSKAINLKLKDAYKKGFFGKVDALGSQDYYSGTLLLQAYKGKTKFGVYGLGSNSGTVGIDFDDRSKYMNDGPSFTSFEDGNMYLSFNSDDDDDSSWSGRYNGEGLPQSYAVGSSLSTAVFQDKIKLNVNYGYSLKEIDILKSENNKYFLPDSSYNQEVEIKSSAQTIKHSIAGSVNYKIDSLTTFTYTFSGSDTDKDNERISNTLNSTVQNRSITNVDRSNNSLSNTLSYNQSFKLERKFMNPRRSLNINGNIIKSDKDRDAFVRNKNDFFIRNQTSIINQDIYQNSIDKQNLFNIVYNEPISNKWVLQLNGKMKNSISNANRDVYEFDEFGKRFDFISDSLSTIFNYGVKGLGGGLAFSRKTDKTTFRIGFDYENNTFDFKSSDDSRRDTVLVQNRVVPKLSYNYKFNRSSSFRFNYSGYVNPPGLDKIQPIRDNSDPLNVTIGNPKLGQSFTQSVNLGYNFWKALSGQSLWSGLYFSNTFNQIVMATKIDSDGRNVSQYVNADGNYNLNLYSNFSNKIYKKLNGSVGFDLNNSQYVAIINGNESKVRSFGYNPSIGLDIDVEEKLYFSTEYTPSWNVSKGGVVGNDGSFFSHEFELDGNYKFTKDLTIATSFDANFQKAATSFDQDFSYNIWNVKLTQKLLKDKSLELSLGVKDILNQNVGYRRNVGSYTVSEIEYNTIRRYAYINLVYNFKSKIAEEESNETISITK